MPDLEEAWASACDKPGGKEKFLRKCAPFTVLVIDEWLLDTPDEHIRSMLLELLERRCDSVSTVFCTQYPNKDWHQRLGSGVHADAIMDRIVHRTIWIETGSTNMREHDAVTSDMELRFEWQEGGWSSKNSVALPYRLVCKGPATRSVQGATITVVGGAAQRS
jgi:hypothetical protein